MFSQPPWYGSVCRVVWGDGAPRSSYPIFNLIDCSIKAKNLNALNYLAKEKEAFKYICVDENDQALFDLAFNARNFHAFKLIIECGFKIDKEKFIHKFEEMLDHAPLEEGLCEIHGYISMLPEQNLATVPSAEEADNSGAEKQRTVKFKR